jgi:hypothetical protein
MSAAQEIALYGAAGYYLKSLGQSIGTNVRDFRDASSSNDYVGMGASGARLAGNATEVAGLASAAGVAGRTTYIAFEGASGKTVLKASSKVAPTWEQRLAMNAENDFVGDQIVHPVKVVSRLEPRVDVASKFKFKSRDNGAYSLSYGRSDTHGLDAYVDKNGILGFEIKAGGDATRLGSGKDMFYSMMRRLQSEGVEVNGINGQWQAGGRSTNYDGYHAARLTGASAEEAAATTWTGQRAEEFGFTHVESVEEIYKGVRAKFRKPPKDPSQ